MRAIVCHKKGKDDSASDGVLWSAIKNFLLYETQNLKNPKTDPDWGPRPPDCAHSPGGRIPPHPWLEVNTENPGLKLLQREG